MGDGTGKEASPKPSNSISPWRDHKSDDGDGSSSRYSSCGESEFERYCSANSAMGTPSMCSTVSVFNDCNESEFGSLRNSPFGDESGGLDNFSLGGRVERNRDEIKCLSDGKIEFCNRDFVRGRTSTNYGSTGFELYGSDELNLGSEVEVGASSLNELMSRQVEPESSSSPLKRVSELKNGLDKDDSGGGGEESLMMKRGVDDVGVAGNISVEEMCSQESNNLVSVGNESKVALEVEECSLDPIAGGKDGNCFDGLKPESDFYGDIKEMEGQEDGTSSRNEHSEGEDSMYNCGTDDEDKSGLDRHNVHYQQEMKTKNENPLLINSSVAFGSEDWDDFEQESEGTRQASDLFIKSASQNQAEKSVEIKRKLLDSTPVTSVGFPSSPQEEGKSQVEGDNTLDNIVNNLEAPAGFLNLDESQVVEDVKDIPVASYQVQGSHDLVEFTKSSFTTPSVFARVPEQEQEEICHIPCTVDQGRGSDELENYPKKFELEPLEEEFPVKAGFDNMDDDMSQAHQNMTTKESINIDDGRSSKNLALGNSKIKLDPLDDKSANQPSSHSTVSFRSRESDFLEDYKPKTDLSSFTNGKRRNLAVSEDNVGARPALVQVRCY